MRPPTTTTSGRFSQCRNGASVRSLSPTSRCRMMREPSVDRLGQREVQLAEAQGEHRSAQRIPESGIPAGAVVVVVRLRACRPEAASRSLARFVLTITHGCAPRRLDAVVDAWLADLGRRPPGAELRGDEASVVPRDPTSTGGHRHETVAVGVREVVVRPGSARRLQPAQVELSLGDDHRPRAADRGGSGRPWCWGRRSTSRSTAAGRSAASGRRCPRAGCCRGRPGSPAARERRSRRSPAAGGRRPGGARRRAG